MSAVRRRAFQLVMIAGLAGSAVCTGCGHSPRADFLAIRSAGVRAQAGDGSTIAVAMEGDERTTRADRALARRE